MRESDEIPLYPAADVRAVTQYNAGNAVTTLGTANTGRMLTMFVKIRFLDSVMQTGALKEFRVIIIIIAEFSCEGKNFN